ncbi:MULTISPECIES: hypothetical protein [unclassified Methylobacterium]|uniref:hypothetical protein n=1 Tax=unclassified Methylobacterium TaxID=2615210 RepID=UPI0011C1E58D|nr:MULTISPECIES: hypothetical protein [unclassified Methylobacterium]QEE39826.1 hypothetical protein FVA80_13555 [Methylobacterium sp. WL1]TXN57330.1 hypothetical protein FV241_11755 [Methylobacterium sp. WL2]
MSSGPAPAPPSSDHEIRIARTEAGLAALGQDVRDLVGAVRGIADKMDANHTAFFDALAKKGQTNWTLIVAIASVAMTGMVYLGSQWREPITQRQEALASEIAALRQAVVPRAEVQGLVRQGERDNDLIRTRIERFEARISKEVERLNGTVYVPAWSKRS